MSNKNHAFLSGVQFAGVVLAGVLAAGCQNDKSSVTEFFPQDEERSTQRFMTVQSASGARADATLQSIHFDGAKLNSLGEAKLDLMLKDDDSVEPLVVYLNVTKMLDDRKEAVTHYLVDRGMLKDQIALKDGPNPDVTSLSAEHLSRLSKTESTGTAEEGDKGSAAGAGASGGTSK